MSKLVCKGDTPDRQLVYGEVYGPDRPDAQGEYMRAEEIEKMAHRFMTAKKTDQIDVMHDNKVVKCNVVESFIAQKGDPTYIEGAWVIGMHVPDADLWSDVKSGKLNGFSMESFVVKQENEVELEIPPVVSGLTSKSESHEHKFYVTYDDEGNFKGGQTDVVDGHMHRILAGTHTEDSKGHRHRFSSVDSLQIT